MNSSEQRLERWTAKSKDKYEFGKHTANVRKLSNALSGYGTCYYSRDGYMCGLIAPSMSALEKTFGQLCDQPFNKTKVRKVLLFKQKDSSSVKAR